MTTATKSKPKTAAERKQAYLENGGRTVHTEVHAMCGDRVFFYPKGRTHKPPTLAFVCADANNSNTASLTICGPGGMYTQTGVIPYGDERFEKFPNLLDNGCWSSRRVDPQGIALEKARRESL